MLQSKSTAFLPIMLAFLAFFAANPAFSQAQKKINIDSLVNIAENYVKEDTVQARLWLTIAKLYANNNPQKGLESAQKAFAISQKVQQPLFIAESFLLKARCKGGLGFYQEAIEIVKQALPIYEESKNNLKISGCWLDLGIYHSRIKQPKIAIECFEKSKILYQKEGYMVGVGASLNGIATAYLNSGQAQESVSYLQEGLKITTQYGNKYEVSNFNANLGMAYLHLGDYPKSLDYYQKALPVIEESNRKNVIASVYNNISIIYQNIGDLKKSLDYQIKSLALARELNNSRSIAENLNNIGAKYNFLNDKKQALSYHLQAVEMAETMNDTTLLVMFYQSLGDGYIDLNDYSRGFYYVNKSLKMSETEADNETIGNNFFSLGKIYNLASDSVLQVLHINPQERFAKSEAAFLQAIKYMELANQKPSLSLLWNQLSDLYEKKGDYTNAYRAFSKYIAIKDSISGDEVKQQITRKEIQYEFDKKETALKYEQQLTADQLEKQKLLTVQQGQALTLNQQNLTLKEQALALSNKEKDLEHLAYLKEQAEKQENADQLALSEEREKGKERDLTLKNLELSAQQKRNLYLGVFAVLLLGGLGTLSYFYTILKKQKNIIAQQNELNEQTIAILSHDIKEPLLGVKLLLKKLKKDDPFVAQASQSLENQINSVNSILTNLLKMKKLSLVKKDKNVRANALSVVQNVTTELGVAIRSKFLTIQNDLKTDLMLPIAPEKLQIIVHNLLSNAVKYSFPNQSIRIFKEGNGFCIQDFGVGLSPEQRTKLMREVTASERGTNQERGNGLGLFLVGAMLQGEQLKVVFDSPEIGGTIAKVLG